MFKDLERHFTKSHKQSIRQIDLWLTLLALIACIETFGVCVLATYRYARRVYNLRLQRWTMRIILIGPIYSWLMWVALWKTRWDYYIAIPIGFYEAYAFFCFYAMLVSFADGEDRLIAALSGLPGPPTAFVYHPFGDGCVSLWECRLRRTLSSSTSDRATERASPPYTASPRYTPLFGTWRAHYASCLTFSTSRDLLRHLRRGVSQAMVVKPLNVVLMIFLSRRGFVVAANSSRLVSILSLWLVANSLTQLYHVVLPRIRGLGGEQLFVLLLLMIVVMIVQDIVCSALLINSGKQSATDPVPTRLIFILTILEITAFSTIFYRLLPPEKFATLAWSNSNVASLSTLAPPPPTSMSIEQFIWVIIDPRTAFAVPRGRENQADLRRASSNGNIQCVVDYEYGVKETKREDDDFVYDEKTPLMKGAG